MSINDLGIYQNTNPIMERGTTKAGQEAKSI